MGRLCYPTQHPGRFLVPRASGARKLSRCKEGMAHFLPSRYKILWTLRVSRYKLVRSQKFITGYNLGCEHWRGRGISHYISVLGVGAKAKSVTSPLIIPSVLGFRAFIFFFFLDFFPFFVCNPVSGSTRSISHYKSKIMI